jgi:hypothetical protein
MHRLVTLGLCALGLVCVRPSSAASNAIAAEPSAVSPGQAVTLRWYFTGKKVVVSGGRFGKGAVVTGRTSLIDHPRKTTRYIFDVWYRAPVTSQKTGKTQVEPLHARYAVVVDVLSGEAARLKPYRDPNGWQISYLSDWKLDQVKTPDEGRDGINYFQKEDDSVERLALAILPVKETTCTDLMQQVCADMPEHYDHLEMGPQDQITYGDVPAVWASFTGMDHTHPGTRTQTVLLVLVRNGRGYVVSARTKADQFSARRALLEKMVKSLTFTETRNASFLDRSARAQ